MLKLLRLRLNPNLNLVVLRTCDRDYNCNYPPTQKEYTYHHTVPWKMKDVDPLNISFTLMTDVTLLLNRSWLKDLEPLNMLIWKRFGSMLLMQMNLSTLHLDRSPLKALSWWNTKRMLVACVTFHLPNGRYGPWSNHPPATVCMRRQRLRDHLCAVVENCSVTRSIPGLQ